LYKKQFQTFLDDLQIQLLGEQSDRVRIVLVGDLFHQKITVSNEQIILASWFLTELTKLGRVIIIPGNHDFLENNMERIDTITPIVQLLNNPEIKYYKDSGPYDDGSIEWIVYSLYNHNQRPEFTKNPDKFTVGLFHGPIQGMATDLGFKFDDAYDRLNFVGLGLLLCGDIHLRQAFKLPNGGDAVMIGSLIQQNFGENIKDHGYGMFDMDTKKYTFHDLKNEQPFLHFRIDDIKDIETESEHLVNS
jgi:DNA repair exonuclease SbcCD nuclease subunit